MGATSGVGALVRARRRARGLSQTRLGELAGVSQNYISKLENGEIDLPQRGTLEALGRVLDVALAEFYRAAGVLEDVPAAPPPPPAVPANGGEVVDPARVVAYVEAKPGEQFRARLAALKAALPPEDYTRICLKIYAAWTSNEDLGLSLGEMLARRD